MSSDTESNFSNESCNTPTTSDIKTKVDELINAQKNSKYHNFALLCDSDNTSTNSRYTESNEETNEETSEYIGDEPKYYFDLSTDPKKIKSFTIDSDIKYTTPVTYKDTDKDEPKYIYDILNHFSITQKSDPNLYAFCKKVLQIIFTMLIFMLKHPAIFFGLLSCNTALVIIGIHNITSVIY